jgi:hypothetical protein
VLERVVTMPMPRDDSGIRVLNRLRRRRIRVKHLDPAAVKVRVLQKDRLLMPQGVLS